MTDIRVRLVEQGSTRRLVPLGAVVSMAPTRAVAVEYGAAVAAGGLLLPTPVAIAVPNADELIIYGVEPCDGTEGWAYAVTVTVDGVVRWQATVLVPNASTAVDLEDLPQVDPTTLAVVPPAVWEAVAAAAGASASAASASAASAQAASDTATAAAAAITRDALTPGNRCVWVGDSLTQWQDSEANDLQRLSLANLASILSGQRLRYTYNAGVGGTTTAQMLTNFASVVPSKAPTVVHILGGTNDTALAVSQTITNLAGLVAAARAIGAEPILGTPPPRGVSAGTDGERHRLAALRIAILDWALANRVAVVDYYRVMMNPATGFMYAAFDSGDGTHPNGAGFAAMGQIAADTISPLLPALPPPLTVSNEDPRNQILNPLFLTGGATGTGAANWTGGTGTGITNSIITDDPNIVGNWVHIAAAGSTSTMQMYQTIATAPTPGHRYLFAGRLKTTWASGANGINVRVGITAPGNPNAGAFYNVPAAISNGVFAVEYVMPAGATAQMVSVSMAAGTMSVDVAQMTLWDLDAAYAVTA